MTVQEVITSYADLLDSLDLPSQKDWSSTAETISGQAEELRQNSEDRQAATLLAEISASCQSLISGSRSNLLGRHGLRIRMVELGLVGQDQS